MHSPDVDSKFPTLEKSDERVSDRPPQPPSAPRPQHRGNKNHHNLRRITLNLGRFKRHLRRGEREREREREIVGGRGEERRRRGGGGGGAIFVGKQPKHSLQFEAHFPGRPPRRDRSGSFVTLVSFVVAALARTRNKFTRGAAAQQSRSR